MESLGSSRALGGLQSIRPISAALLGQPLTRNVTDAALPMAVFSKPDARDYTALPYQEIDWIGSLRGDVKGKKLGLMLETGVGLKPQPAVRQAIAKAGKALARAGAIVEPVAPFFTRGMLDGLDIFWAAGSRCSRSPPSGQQHRLLYL
jgi:aspartyl-tRNA(Asn)/glutamyl-tRNA(Gln) amidotransferase subunit A